MGPSACKEKNYKLINFSLYVSTIKRWNIKVLGFHDEIKIHLFNSYIESKGEIDHIEGILPNTVYEKTKNPVPKIIIIAYKLIKILNLTLVE